MTFENNMNVNHEEYGKRAVDALANDIAILASGIGGKSPENIDFDAVLEYIELLKAEVERVQQGIYAKDNSIYYTSGGEISFDKASKTR